MQFFCIPGWLAAPISPDEWSSSVSESTKLCVGSFTVAGLLAQYTERNVLLQLLIYRINVLGIFLFLSLGICKMYVDWTKIKHS